MKIQDRPILQAIINETECRLVGCDHKDIAAMLATLKSGFPNDATFATAETVMQRAVFSQTILADVPGWLLSTALFDACRELARSPNPRDRGFMPTDAMILAAALPQIDALRDQMHAATRLLRKMDEDEFA